MFSGLMPKRKEFFDLLIAHSDRVVASANATLRLVNNVGTESPEDIELLAKEVDFNEKSGDKIKAELIALLHKSFITPLDRDESRPESRRQAAEETALGCPRRCGPRCAGGEEGDEEGGEEGEGG